MTALVPPDRRSDSEAPAGDQIAPHIIKDCFDELDLSPSENQAVLANSTSDTLGWILYGSRARTDSEEESDFDLIRVCARRASTLEIDRLSISTYSLEDLKRTSSTLFGTHLSRDARVLWSKDSAVPDALNAIEDADPLPLLTRTARYAVALNFPSAETLQHLEGSVFLARYLLRTALYAREMFRGQTTFSVRQLAERLGDVRLATLLTSKRNVFPEPSIALFEEIVARLVELLGPLPPHPYETLEALAADCWFFDRELSSLAIRAGLDRGSGIAYTDLVRVAL